MIITADELISVICGGIATLGFGILFNIRGTKLWFSALGGLIAWLCFVLLGNIIANEPIRYFIVAVIASVYAEVFSRIMKTPRTTFWMMCLIPLVPGGSLYYTMSSAISESPDFSSRAIYTLSLAAALSMGIVLVTAGSKWIGDRKRRKESKLSRKK